MRSGQIYHVDNVPDERGRNPKGRYVVIVSRTEDISPDNGVIVVACTASLKHSQAGDAVELPHDPSGRARTGFRKPTWAKPKWYKRMELEQLGEYRGFVPGDALRRIIDLLPPET